MEEDRKTRREIASESELNPLSLCGSWFLELREYSDRTYGVMGHGLVVGEAQPGFYIVEFFGDKRFDAYQMVVPLARLFAGDEAVEWRFYDSEVWMNQAFRQISDPVERP